MASGEIPIQNLPLAGAVPLTLQLLVTSEAGGTQLVMVDKLITDASNLAASKSGLPNVVYRDPKSGYALRSTPPATPASPWSESFKQLTYEDVAPESIAWTFASDDTRKHDHVFALVGSGAKTIALPSGFNVSTKALGGGLFEGFVYSIGFIIPSGMTATFTPPGDGTLIGPDGTAGAKTITGYRRVFFAVRGLIWDLI